MGRLAIGGARGRMTGKILKTDFLFEWVDVVREVGEAAGVDREVILAAQGIMGATRETVDAARQIISALPFPVIRSIESIRSASDVVSTMNIAYMKLKARRRGDSWKGWPLGDPDGET